MQVYTIAKRIDIENEEFQYVVLDGENTEIETFDNREDALSLANQLNRETYKNIYGGVSILRDLYDQSERDGVIGFPGYEHAEQCAKDTGGEVRLLCQPYGKFFYSDKGYQPGPLTSRDYIDYQNETDPIEIADEELIICAAKNAMDMNVNTLHDLYAVCDEYERLVCRFRSKSDKQDVLVWNGKYVYTIDKELMYFQGTGGFYTIGVMF